MIFIHQYVGDVTNKLLEKALPKEAFGGRGKLYSKEALPQKLLLVKLFLKASFGKAFSKSFFVKTKSPC